MEYKNLSDGNENVVLEGQKADIPNEMLLFCAFFTVVAPVLILSGFLIDGIILPLIIIGVLLAALDIWMFGYFIQQKLYRLCKSMVLTDKSVVVYDKMQGRYIKVPLENIAAWSHGASKGYGIGIFIFKTGFSEYKTTGVGNYIEMLAKLFRVIPSKCENPPTGEFLERLRKIAEV